MSLYDSSKNLIAGTGNIAAVEAVIPSDASASNKLVTKSDALIYYQSDSSNITDFNNAVPQTGNGAIQMFYLGSNITNAPTSSGGGFIVVAEQLSTTYISQLATQIGTNNKYTRSKSTNGWTSWQKLVTESDLTSSVTSGSTAPITSGGVFNNTVCRKGSGATDANSIKENGIFFTSTGWSNLPSGASYGTLVMFYNTNNEGVQVFFGTTAGQQSKMCFRSWAANTWTSWVSVTGA